MAQSIFKKISAATVCLFLVHGAYAQQVRKFSQIAPASGVPSPTDQVVGVTGGNTDNLYSINQLISSLFTNGLGSQTALTQGAGNQVGFAAQKPNGNLAPVWNRIGVAIDPTKSSCGDSPGVAEERSVIYDSNPQILLTQANVFKMWYHGLTHYFYAESANGIDWTCYSGNPLGSPFTASAYSERPTVIKSGGTYVMWVANGSFTAVDRLTSTDGIHWSVANSGVITSSGVGWETEISNPHVYLDQSGTYYMSYGAFGGVNNIFQTGMASSPDGIVWTKSPNNPIINFISAGSLWFTKVGSNYWGWSHSSVPFLSLPSDMRRFTTSNPMNAWTQSPSTTTFVRATWDEGASGNNAGGNVAGGQVGDIELIEVNGRTFMYYEAVHDQAAFNTAPESVPIKVAVANMPISQLVTTNEGDSGPVFPDLSIKTLPSSLTNVTVPAQTMWLPGTQGNPLVIGGSTYANHTPEAGIGAAATIQSDGSTITRTTVGANLFRAAGGNLARINQSQGGAAYEFQGGENGSDTEILVTFMSPTGVQAIAYNITADSLSNPLLYGIGPSVICFTVGNSCGGGYITGAGVVSGHQVFEFGNASFNGSGMLQQAALWFGGEISSPLTAAGNAFFWDDSTSHRFKFNYNGSADFTVPAIVAQGTSVVGGNSITAGTCDTVVTTSAPHTLSTDTISWSFNAAPGSNWPFVTVQTYPTTDNVNFLVCNPGAVNKTPASVTLNWSVIR